MTTHAHTPPHAGNGVRKRVLIPSLLVLLGGGLLIRDVVRTRPSSAPDHGDASDGVRCAVRQLPGGARPVRCTLVLEHPREAVWAVITDYDHYAEIFPSLSGVSSTRESATRYHVKAVATSPLYSSWPFDITIDHQQAPGADGRWTTSWDAPGGRLTTERGGWTLTSLSPGASYPSGVSTPRTLAAYTLELKVAGVPDLLTKNVMMDNLPKVLRAVEQRLRTRAVVK